MPIEELLATFYGGGRRDGATAAVEEANGSEEMEEEANEVEEVMEVKNTQQTITPKVR